MESVRKENEISTETELYQRQPTPFKDHEDGQIERSLDADGTFLCRDGNTDKNNGSETSIHNISSVLSAHLSLSLNRGSIAGNNIFEPILAVHSNEYINQKREGIRQIAKDLNPTISIPKLDGNPSFSRPKLPFHPWNKSFCHPSLNPDVFLSEFDETFDPHERHDCQETYIPELNIENQIVNFELINFVLKETEETFHREKSPEYEKICTDVRKFLENVCKEMAVHHHVFKNYSIIEMGSMVEGTKFGDPDEFDFMIDLPNLNQSLEFYTEGIDTLGLKHENRVVRVKNRNVFEDFKDLSKDLAEGEDDKKFMRRVWNEIQIELADVMKKNTLPGWKWLDTVPAFTSTLAQTNKLLWKGNIYRHLIVDLDICISLKPPEFETHIDFNQDILDKSRPGISTKGKRKYNRREENIYFLLRSDGEARWTRALLEKEIWASFPEEDGRKTILRSLKYFDQRYIPKRYNEILFRMEPAIPSYWLKTIVFYLMAWYYEDSCWTKNNLSFRFFEACIILKECLYKKNLSSFFVPHNILGKLCPFGSEDEDYKKLVKDVINATEYLKIPQKFDKNDIRTIETEIENHNSVERDKGVFDSVIELCYLYAFNDFADENRKALQSFLDEIGNEQFTLIGEGSELKLLYLDSTADINCQIAEKYGETKLYFS
ncbi:uncharacterized protein LOC134250548 [Saccostrea cucullata]|uniref:uncharacterized protein LOC134250548 n=1 Tax=Saccostrea cuccullata TaxID=36930 RepID=UPI002ED39DA8